MNEKNVKDINPAKEMKPEKNLFFVGKQQRFNSDTGKYETVLRESPEYLIDGGALLPLPPNLEKGAAVEQELADKAIALFPADFKRRA